LGFFVADSLTRFARGSLGDRALPWWGVFGLVEFFGIKNACQWFWQALIFDWKICCDSLIGNFDSLRRC